METTEATVSPSTCSCQTTSAEPVPAPPPRPSFVYAVGAIDARFPSLGVEKEFMQTVRKEETANKTDREVLCQVLRANRHLAREVCWVLRVEGLDAYILRARDTDLLDLFVDALSAPSSLMHRDVVIGLRGPLAPPEMCNGLMVPIVVVDQLYSFDVSSFLSSIPKSAAAPDAPAGSAEEVLLRILHMTDNVGETDEHRALNYLALRYPAIYTTAAEMFAKDCLLSTVDVRPDVLSGARKILAVIMTFVSRKTEVTEKFAARVDVTEKWPFLVSKLQSYFDRTM